jgi:acyl-CoA synthetase (AMP-forming)/AMP-acid ligase II
MKSFAILADWGVEVGTLQASYAMAENVFAVTLTTPGTIPATFARSCLRHRAAEPDQLAFDLIDSVYVSSGKPLAGVEVRIVNDAGELCSDAEPGEIRIRTESLFAGFGAARAFVATSLSADGWYSTGDYGFMSAGSCT